MGPGEGGLESRALIVEVVVAATKSEKNDRLARDFSRFLVSAFSTTAVFGLLGLTTLVVPNPKFTTSLGEIFSPTYLPFAGLITTRV